MIFESFYEKLKIKEQSPSEELDRSWHSEKWQPRVEVEGQQGAFLFSFWILLVFLLLSSFTSLSRKVRQSWYTSTKSSYV